MNIEIIKHDLRVAVFMEQEIHLYVNNQLNFINLVDNLNGQADQIKENAIAGFIEEWINLDIIYAETNNIRGFYTPEEIISLSTTLTKLTRLLRAYKEACLAKLTPEETEEVKEEVNGLLEEPALKPMVITDTTKRTNLKLLIKLELTIYFYSNYRKSLGDIVISLQSIINDLRDLSIDQFLNPMRELRNICESLDANCKKYTFEQAAMICKQLIESTKLIEQYKETYLADPYERRRFQGMLARWPEDIETLKVGFITAQAHEDNIASVEFMIEQIESYGFLMSQPLLNLIQELENQSINISPQPIKGLLDELIKLELLTDCAAYNKREYFTFDETALIFGYLNHILKILVNFSSPTQARFESART